MIQVHSTVGLIVIVLGIVTFLWNLFSRSSSTGKLMIRRVYMGLFDLQVLLGIITFALHPQWGLFVIHPILMIVAVALTHIFTKPTRPVGVQRAGYLVSIVLMIIGALR